MITKGLMIVGLATAIGFAASAAQAQMPAGDAAKGEQVFKKCAACHSAEAGVNKVGPSLHGVVGRKAGSTDFPRYVGLKGAVIGINRFGESAPAGKLFEFFGFTVANVVATVKNIL